MISFLLYRHKARSSASILYTMSLKACKLCTNRTLFIEISKLLIWVVQIEYTRVSRIAKRKRK